MKVKLLQINNAQSAVKKLSAIRKRPKDAYAIMKWVRDEFEPKLQLANDQRNEWIKKYGEEEKGGFQIKPDSPNMVKFLEEFGEFLETEDEIKPFPLSMDELVESLSYDEEVLVTGSCLSVIEGFTKEGEKH